MQKLRSFIFWLWLILITPIFSFIAIVVSWLPALYRFRIISGWSYLVIKGARFCCGVRYQVRGQENLPILPVVFLSRHESAWETIAYQCILPPQVFVLKKSLLNIPFFGWGLRQMSPIAIDRKQKKKSLLQISEQGKQRLQAKFCVVVFPEGTRMTAKEDRHYLPGGAHLAKSAEVDVIPIHINSGNCWPKGWMLFSGMITVSIGKPIKTQSLTVTEINDSAKQWITGTRNSNLE